MGSAAAIRAVVFDVDGVLVDIRFPTALPEMLSITPEEAKRFYEGPFLKCLVGESELREVLPPYLERWGWSGTFDKFTRLWFEIESNVNHPLLAVAEQLRESGLLCYIASTQEQMRARYLERLLAVGERFERGFFSCDLGCRKPDKRFYEFVASAIARPPGEILLVDDQSLNVESAVAAGWRAICYRVGEDENEVLRAAWGGASDASLKKLLPSD